MQPFPPWADLPPELLCRIGEGLEDFQCYASARGACTAWRRALAPPSPSLLLVPDDASRCVPSAASLPTRLPSAASLPTRCPSAASLLTRRSFELKPMPWGARCVGSSDGWLVLSVGHRSTFFTLFNPVTAAEIVLPPLIYEGSWASKSKLVFTHNPASDDFAAAAICDVDRLAYVTAGARRWVILEPIPLAHGDQLADAVYHEENGKGRVYCLTRYGDVHVLRLPERCRKPMVVDDPSPGLLSPAEQQRDMIRRRLLCAAGKHPDMIPRRPRFISVDEKQNDMIRRRSVGPDLNAPATVEPLLSVPFDPATSFAPPCNTVSAFTGAKNLVFCEGNLYQVWRNTSCTVTVKLPGGGRRRVAENEVLVLRYYPRRQPCWDAVTDLGGYSVFLGRNNAASMHAQGDGVLGIKGNCVYWIGGRGRDKGMVFDMATGRTTACLLPPAAAGVASKSTICWYFLSDNCNK